MSATILALVLAGGLTGFLVGLTGIGGGALLTPILLLLFKIPVISSIATDILLSLIIKLIAAFIHDKAGQVDWIIVRRLWMGSIPATILSVLWLQTQHHHSAPDWLPALIGCLVLVTAVSLVFTPRLFAFGRQQRLNFPLKFKALQPALTILSGIVLGLSVSLTSVGAGTLGSVILLTLYPLRMVGPRLIATDITHAIPVGAIAAIGYIASGGLNWHLLFELLIGAIPGVFIGASLASRVSARKLQITLAIVLVLLGISLISKSLVSGIFEVHRPQS